MNLLKSLLTVARKRTETPADRRRRLLREAFTPAQLQSGKRAGRSSGTH